MALQLIIRNMKSWLDKTEKLLFIINNKFPPPGLNLAITNPSYGYTYPNEHTFLESLKDGFLWGVPKHRRSLAKRLKRKYGNLDQVYKLLIPKKDLIVCVHCGHDHKRGYLCPNCFKKVMDETQVIQDRIMEELKLEPIDQEVIVLYDKEKESEPNETWNGKRIVEIPKERPKWFSKNLIQKATTTTSDSTEIKPEQLG